MVAKKKVTKEKSDGVSVDQMKLALEEMITVMGMVPEKGDPLFDTDGDIEALDVAGLKKQIVFFADSIDAADTFTPATMTVFSVLNIDVPGDAPSPAKKTTAKKVTPAVKEKATTKKAKTPVTKKTTATKEKLKAPAKKGSAAPAYTRSHALVDAIKKGGDRKTIVAFSDDLFVKNGGSTNNNVANYMFGYCLPSLIIVGVVTKSKDGIFAYNG